MKKEKVKVAKKSKSQADEKETVFQPIDTESPYPSKVNPFPPMKLGGGRHLFTMSDTLFDEDLY